MVSKKELAICKRRGHDSPTYGNGWAQCKWCGLWRRKVTTFEEREDEPPEDEMESGVRSDREIARLQSRLGIAATSPPAKKRRK